MKKKTLKIAGVALLAALGVGVVATLVVRDQLGKHRRDLFSPNMLRRLAALGHMAAAEASVDNINLLRDFISWESRALLRGRATAIVKRMEMEAQAEGP